MDWVPTVWVHAIWGVAAAIGDSAVCSSTTITCSPCEQCLPWPSGTSADGTPWQMARIPVISYVVDPALGCKPRSSTAPAPYPESEACSSLGDHIRRVLVGDDYWPYLILGLLILLTLFVLWISLHRWPCRHSRLTKNDLEAENAKLKIDLRNRNPAEVDQQKLDDCELRARSLTKQLADANTEKSEFEDELKACKEHGANLQATICAVEQAAKNIQANLEKQLESLNVELEYAYAEKQKHKDGLEDAAQKVSEAQKTHDDDLSDIHAECRKAYVMLQGGFDAALIAKIFAEENDRQPPKRIGEIEEAAETIFKLKVDQEKLQDDLRAARVSQKAVEDHVKGLQDQLNIADEPVRDVKVKLTPNAKTDYSKALSECEENCMRLQKQFDDVKHAQVLKERTGKESSDASDDTKQTQKALEGARRDVTALNTALTKAKDAESKAQREKDGVSKQLQTVKESLEGSKKSLKKCEDERSTAAVTKSVKKEAVPDSGPPGDPCAIFKVELSRAQEKIKQLEEEAIATREESDASKQEAYDKIQELEQDAIYAGDNYQQSRSLLVQDFEEVGKDASDVIEELMQMERNLMNAAEDSDESWDDVREKLKQALEDLENSKRDNATQGARPLISPVERLSIDFIGRPLAPRSGANVPPTLPRSLSGGSWPKEREPEWFSERKEMEGALCERLGLRMPLSRFVTSTNEDDEDEDEDEGVEDDENCAELRSYLREAKARIEELEAERSKVGHQVEETSTEMNTESIEGSNKMALPIRSRNNVQSETLGGGSTDSSPAAHPGERSMLPLPRTTSSQLADQNTQVVNEETPSRASEDSSRIPTTPSYDTAANMMGETRTQLVPVQSVSSTLIQLQLPSLFDLFATSPNIGQVARPHPVPTNGLETGSAPPPAVEQSVPPSAKSIITEQTPFLLIPEPTDLNESRWASRPEQTRAVFPPVVQRLSLPRPQSTAANQAPTPANPGLASSNTVTLIPKPGQTLATLRSVARPPPRLRNTGTAPVAVKLGDSTNIND